LDSSSSSPYYDFSGLQDDSSPERSEEFESSCEDDEVELWNAQAEQLNQFHKQRKRASKKRNQLEIEGERSHDENHEENELFSSSANDFVEDPVSASGGESAEEFNPSMVEVGVERERDKEGGSAEREEEREISSSRKGREKSVPQMFTVDELLDYLISLRWQRMAEERLRYFVEQRHGSLTDEEWIEKKQFFDLFLAEEMPYCFSSFLVTDRNKFWNEAWKSQYCWVEEVIADVVSASATEACCERGFSFLRYVVTKRRKRLHMTQLEDILILRTDREN
jgi:hypothetical protein